jgi:hypothetical protein
VERIGGREAAADFMEKVDIGLRAHIALVGNLY